ncbi:IclR family transcriptional regulator [Actinoallomurus bryophytorum]|uniref:IclR family transcriptional regulator n=1 Tax=Actinoallomurus bryophytorum TaxID=1490222 RepID=A0A543CTP2_9ACTN|nr:IclR family transcriptional regulator [Actinoallomurus bryophytorum]TQM00472.1 IclR family transcriptional regulator [Actinoallomurus bryophytorum]
MAAPSRRTKQAPIDETRPASANYHANALARGLALLEQMAMRPEPPTLGDFAEHTALPKSTLVRLLSVLCELEYAVRVDDRPSYRLGHKVQRLATAYVSSLDLSVVAGQYLRPVAGRTGQTANLGVLDGAQVLHICVTEPDRPLRFMAPPGTRDHAYCTGLGKVLLAHVEPGVLRSSTPAEPFPAFTDQTITTLAGLTEELRLTRERGSALDDNERSAGLRCVAVPLLFGGECLAAISVSGPSGEFTEAQQEDYVAELKTAAEGLTADPDFDAALRIVHRSLRPAGFEPAG